MMSDRIGASPFSIKFPFSPEVRAQGEKPKVPHKRRANKETAVATSMHTCKRVVITCKEKAKNKRAKTKSGKE